MDIFIIIPTQLLLLLHTPAPHRLLDVPLFILAADHEPDLAARIRRDGGVGVFDSGEDLLARFLEVGD